MTISEIFDFLKKYIDKKISESSVALERLFIKYKTKEVGENIDDILDIANKYVFAFKYTVNSIKDISSISGQKNGDVVFVKGYHEPNDGGGGIFIWDSKKQKINHNGGTIIDPLKIFPDDFLDNDKKLDWFNGTNDGYGCWVRYNYDYIPFKAFGAIGDGVSDDTIQIYKTIYECDKITGNNLNYKIKDSINIDKGGICIKDAFFDCSDFNTESKFVFSFSGKESDCIKITEDLLKGNNIIKVEDASIFNEDDFIAIKSERLFSEVGNVKTGHIARIKTIDTANNTIELYDNALYDFLVSDYSCVSRLEMLNEIKLDNIKAIGSNSNNHSFVIFDKCYRPIVSNLKTELFPYISVVFSRCVDSIAKNNYISKAYADGLSYGIGVFNGSYNTLIEGNSGTELRHLVTIGDNDLVNVFTKIINNHSITRDAGIDSHPSGDFTTIANNTIVCENNISGESDGITYQGCNVVISNNIITEAKRHSIFVQQLANSDTSSISIYGNIIKNSGGNDTTDIGINVSIENGSYNSIDSITIANNTITTSINEVAIQVYAKSGNAKNINISGNSTQATTSKGILIRTATGYSVSGINIANNIFRGTSIGEGVYLLCSDSGSIFDGVISNNTIDSFLFGIRILGANNIIEKGNNILNYGNPYEVDATATNIYLDSKKYPILNVTNSTFALEEHNDYIICNRAETITLILKDASQFPSKEIFIKTIQPYSVVSASKNVVPIDSDTPGTEILPATAGASVILKSDGTNWVIIK